MLQQFLTENIFAFLLIFTRVGAGMMVMPGIGESYIPARIRLLFALWVSVLLVPLFQDYFSAPPGSVDALSDTGTNAKCHPIGILVAKENGADFILANGKPLILNGRAGYNHFSRARPTENSDG